MAAAGADNVTFVLADAQTDSFPGAPFDAAISQFGVMFFDDPVAAFANIRAQLRPGGRLAFACWQPLRREPLVLPRRRRAVRPAGAAARARARPDGAVRARRRRRGRRRSSRAPGFAGVRARAARAGRRGAGGQRSSTTFSSRRWACRRSGWTEARLRRATYLGRSASPTGAGGFRSRSSSSRRPRERPSGEGSRRGPGYSECTGDRGHLRCVRLDGRHEPTALPGLDRARVRLPRCGRRGAPPAGRDADRHASPPGERVRTPARPTPDRRHGVRGEAVRRAVRALRPASGRCLKRGVADFSFCPAARAS